MIRQGYETLDLPATEGLERWGRFREAEERGMVKRVGRVAVEDARRLVREVGDIEVRIKNRN